MAKETKEETKEVASNVLGQPLKLASKKPEPQAHPFLGELMEEFGGGQPLKLASKKPEPQAHPFLGELMEEFGGADTKCPRLKIAVFRDTVTSSTGTPETAFYDGSMAQGHKGHRKARMWFTPFGVVCSQDAELILVPHANVRYVKVL